MRCRCRMSNADMQSILLIFPSERSFDGNTAPALREQRTQPMAVDSPYQPTPTYSRARLDSQRSPRANAHRRFETDETLTDCDADRYEPFVSRVDVNGRRDAIGDSRRRFPNADDDDMEVLSRLLHHRRRKLALRKPSLFPLAHISPYLTNWQIRVRVSNKGIVHRWNKGESKSG